MYFPICGVTLVLSLPSSILKAKILLKPAMEFRFRTVPLHGSAPSDPDVFGGIKLEGS